MGYANIENTLRDRIAEILCDSRRHPQALGEPQPKDYTLADCILEEIEKDVHNVSIV